jgi:mannan endo-1,4-beta-mannosidase
MKNGRFPALAAIAAVFLFFSSCAEIPYPEGGALVVTASKGSDSQPPEAFADKYKQKKYDLFKKDYSREYFPDEPYLIEEGEGFTAQFDLTSSQHYLVGISVLTADPDYAGDGAVVSLSVSGEVFGAFYANASGEYETLYIDHVYLSVGKNELIFTSLRASAKIESVSVENSLGISSERYKTLPKLCAPDPSLSAACTFDYLTACFGNKTLTGQHCTINTDAELEAVRNETGRYPAVRCGDLANYSRGYKGLDKDENREIELAEEWSRKGGIVFFTWTWYAPDESGGYFADEGGFSLKNAVTPTDVSRMSREQLSESVETGAIPAVCALLVRDIDDMAETLARLAEKEIPVLWQPLPDGGSRLYWWGASGGESYVWLWRLVFDRMTYYHGLNNLIWVWSGGGYEYYPGDDCADIIGESVYKGVAVGSEAVRFGYTSDYRSRVKDGDGSGSAKKPAGVTDSGGLPAIDALARDNAWWLFWQLYRGDYVIDENGAVKEEIKGALDRFYYHEFTVCLDELPDVRNFGIIS